MADKEKDYTNRDNGYTPKRTTPKQQQTTHSETEQAAQQPTVQEQNNTQPVTTETEQPAPQTETQETSVQPVMSTNTQVLQPQDSNETQQQNVDVTANKNAAMKSVYDFYRKNGNVSRYNGVDYVMQNGRAIPLFKDVDTMLGVDGKYHQFDADGNMMNDEYAGKYTLTDGGNELLNNMFDYFDAHGFDDKSVYNYDFMRTEGNVGNMYELAKSLGVETGKPGWKQRLLDKVKEEYRNRNSNTTEAQNYFDEANMPVASEPVVNTDASGNEDAIQPEEINEFFQKAKKFHTTQKDNPAMYSYRQQYVKDFQKYMADFMEKHPSIKERVQNGINWRGKDGKEFFPVDGNYGQNTTSVMWHILDMIGGEDAVGAFGGQYNPNTDSFEPNDDNDAAREYYEGLGLTADERHEKKRLERQQKLTNMANLFSGIGDTISGSQGVQVKDKSDEITQDAELIDKKKADNEKDYKDRMDALRKRFDDARTERRKEAIQLAMMREQQRFNAEQAELDRKYKKEMQNEEFDWKSKEAAKELDARLRMAREENENRYKIAMLNADASVAAAGGKLKMNNVAKLGSTTITVSPDSEKNFYNSFKSQNAGYYFPNGMQIPSEIAREFNKLKGADDAETQTIIESIYNIIRTSPNDSYSANGATLTRQQVLDYYEKQVLDIANSFSSRYQQSEQATFTPGEFD